MSHSYYSVILIFFGNVCNFAVMMWIKNDNETPRMCSLQSNGVSPHDNDDIDGRSHIEVHADEWTRVDRVQSSLVDTRPRTNRGRKFTYFYAE